MISVFLPNFIPFKENFSNMEQNINIRRPIFHIFYIHFLYCELDWNKNLIISDPAFIKSDLTLTRTLNSHLLGCKVIKSIYIFYDNK